MKKLTFLTIACCVWVAVACAPILPQSGDDPEGGTLGGQAYWLEDAVFFPDEIPNYMVNIRLTYAGQNASGQVVDLTYTTRAEVQQQPQPASRTFMDDGGTSVTVVGGVSYFYQPGSGCFSMPVATDQHLADTFFTPEIESIQGAVRLVAEGKEVNGALTNRYALAAANFSAKNEFEGVTLEQADLYLAQQGHYVVRVVLKGTMLVGPDDALGDLAVGSMADMEYVLNFIPQSAAPAITPPAECMLQADVNDLPTLPDAENVTEFPGGVAYQTRQSLAAAHEFYRAQLAAQGWELISVDAADTYVSLEFVRNGEKLIAQLYTRGDRVSVSLLSQQ